MYFNHACSLRFSQFLRGHMWLISYIVLLIQFFFSELCPFWTLAKMKYYSKQFVSATPLKPLNRISCNFLVMKDLMCRCTYPQKILIQFFFLGVMPLLKLRKLTKIKDTTQNSSSAQLHWNRSTEFLETL